MDTLIVLLISVKYLYTNKVLDLWIMVNWISLQAWRKYAIISYQVKNLMEVYYGNGYYTRIDILIIIQEILQTFRKTSRKSMQTLRNKKCIIFKEKRVQKLFRIVIWDYLNNMQKKCLNYTLEPSQNQKYPFKRIFLKKKRFNLPLIMFPS